MRALLRLSLVSLLLGASASAQAPREVPYQGVLADGGVPVTSATPVTFELFDAAGGGTALWTETQSITPDADGRFAARLGSVTDLPGDFDRPLWLSVTADGTVLGPRTLLGAAPFALSLYGLRVVPTEGTSGDPGTPHVIGGDWENEVVDGLEGVTISGGGRTKPGAIGRHRATGSWGVIGGGISNTVGLNGTVSGGGGNQARGDYATVGGGLVNSADGAHAVIGGGDRNEADAASATVGGGTMNNVYDTFGTIGGGNENIVSDDYGTISGGTLNRVDDRYGAVGGGSANHVTDEYGTVSGGDRNRATGPWTTVGGGRLNRATGSDATISGGHSNVASGLHGMVPGGVRNQARGFASFAGGYQARAAHSGTFVWADRSTGTDSLVTTGVHQFLVRAVGGVGIGTSAPAAQLHVEAGAFGDIIGAYDGTDLRFRVQSTGDVTADGTFTGGGADLAEYFPLDGGATVAPGQVVGLRGGRVSLATDGAEQVAVVSSDPAFIGNPDAADGGALVALVGQVEVHVAGDAAAGDVLIASGSADGRARAIAPSAYALADGAVLGRVLTADGGRVVALVGVDETAALRGVVQRQADRLDRQQAELDALRAEVQAIRDALAPRAVR